MGVWAQLAESQAREVKKNGMNTRQAMRLVAYWKGRRKTSAQDWRTVLGTVVGFAPERKRFTSELIAKDLLLNLIFGDTRDRPQVMEIVEKKVLAYIEHSARILDRDKPDAVPPVIPNRVLDVAAKRLVGFLKTKPARPKKKRGGIGFLIFLAILAKEAS